MPTSSLESQAVVQAYFQGWLTQAEVPDITLTVLTLFSQADALEHLDLSAQSLTANDPLLQQTLHQALAWLLIYPALRYISLHPDDGILNEAIQALLSERRVLAMALTLIRNPNPALGLKNTWWSYCLPALCDANRQAAANALLNTLWRKQPIAQADLSGLNEEALHCSNNGNVAYLGVLSACEIAQDQAIWLDLKTAIDHYFVQVNTQLRDYTEQNTVKLQDILKSKIIRFDSQKFAMALSVNALCSDYLATRLTVQVADHSLKTADEMADLEGPDLLITGFGHKC